MPHEPNWTSDEGRGVVRRPSRWQQRGSETITIGRAGDTMLGRGVAAEINAVGPGELICGEIRDLIGSADLGVINLECCISGRGEPFPAQRFPFRAPPKAAPEDDSPATAIRHVCGQRSDCSRCHAGVLLMSTARVCG